MNINRVIIRYSDICPKCSAVNSFRLTRAFKPVFNFRIAYATCKKCKLHVTVREIKKFPESVKAK